MDSRNCAGYTGWMGHSGSTSFCSFSPAWDAACSRFFPPRYDQPCRWYSIGSCASNNYVIPTPKRACFGLSDPALPCTTAALFPKHGSLSGIRNSTIARGSRVVSFLLRQIEAVSARSQDSKEWVSSLCQFVHLKNGKDCTLFMYCYPLPCCSSA